MSLLYLININSFNQLSDEEQKKVIDHYGSFTGKTDAEIIKWEKQIRKDMYEGKFSI